MKKALQLAALLIALMVLLAACSTAAPAPFEEKAVTNGGFALTLVTENPVDSEGHVLGDWTNLTTCEVAPFETYTVKSEDLKAQFRGVGTLGKWVAVILQEVETSTCHGYRILRDA